jgi:hypothetical protein
VEHDLAPLRHAQSLLILGESSDAVITELFMRFGLHHRDATAAVAAVILLNERGMRVPRHRTEWAASSS